jgi:diamine N-acetyltransferase
MGLMGQEASHISLRSPSMVDAAYILERENDEEAMQVSDHQGGYNLSDIKTFITAAHELARDGQQRWMIEAHELGVVGMIDLFDFDAGSSHAGVGIWLDAEHRKSGIGAQAMRLLCEVTSIKNQLQTIFAHIQDDKRASIAFFERVGFRHTHTNADMLTYRFAI